MMTLPVAQPTDGGRARKVSVWGLLKILMAVALAGFVISNIQPSDLGKLIGRISVPWLIVGVAALVCTTWCLTVRYWILLERQVPLPQMLGIVILQNGLTSFVASAAGLASYLVTLRGEYGISVRRGVMSLLIARWGDVLAIDAALAISSWVLWPQIAPLRAMVTVLLVGITGGLLVLCIPIILPQPTSVAIHKLVRATRLNRVDFMDRTAQRLIMELDADAGKMRRSLLPLTGYSCLIFVLMTCWVYAVVRAFALPIDIWSIAFVGALTQLMTVIPIQVFGGLGVFDVTSMYLYGLFDIAQPESALFIVSLRAILYLVNGLLLLYLPVMAWLNRKRHSADVAAAPAPK